MEGFLFAVVIASIPLIFGTLGELITEKAGNLNLGVEGIMLIGAVISFRVALSTENPLYAILAGFLAGGVAAFIYAVLTISFRVNQVVCGLTLTIFGVGFSSFIGTPVSGLVLSAEFTKSLGAIKIPLLSEIPFFGKVLFSQDIMVYLAFALSVIIALYLNKTQTGLNLRAVGENPQAADASGINVNRYKYIHVLIGGAICSLGGAYMSLIMIPVWQENIVAGRGWIAIALVIFANWKPSKAIIGSLLFGALSILGFRLQAVGIEISQYIVDMIPYIATVIVVLLSTRKNKREDLPPEWLSMPYYREER